MLVPRIAAFEAPKPRPAQPPAAFVFRQIVEYPPLTDQLSAWLDDSLAKFKTHSNADDSVTPDAYVLDDARGESFIAAERTLADRILAARVAKEEAYAERVAAEDATRLERENAEHEAAMEAAAEAQRNLKIAPPAKPRRPRTPPMFPPCGYFASEEGQGSYDTIRNMPGNPHGPIRSIPSPTKHRLHPAVKLADPEPTVIFEHRLLYNKEERCTPRTLAYSAERALVRRPGNDLTLIAYSAYLDEALAVAERLQASDNMSIEVIDLRCLRPLDSETLFKSVRKTHRAALVDESWKTGSFAAEICAQLVEHCWPDLHGPIRRVCSVEVPLLYPDHLAQAARPQRRDLEALARSVLGLVG